MNKERLKLIFAPVLKNKYLLTAFIFMVWISFFDRDNLLDRYYSLRQLHDIEEEKEQYKERIEEDSDNLKKLEDPEYLEKFAREQHLMKKDNEDLFIVVPE